MAVEFPPDFPFHRSRENRSASADTQAWIASRPADESPSMPIVDESESPAAVPVMTYPKIVMEPAGQAPSPDRRRAPRQTLVAKASIRPDTPVQMATLMQSGFVSNISMNGVGFHTRKPLEIGGKYRITVEVGPMKWSSRMRIVSCRHHEDSETFDCGGEFIGNELNRVAA